MEEAIAAPGGPPTARCNASTDSATSGSAERSAFYRTLPVRPLRASLDVSWLPVRHDSAMGTVSWDDFARLASAPVTITLQGRVVSVDEPAERVIFIPPDFWRVEDDHGQLRYLANDTGHYQWHASNDDQARFQRRRPGYWHSGGVNSTELVRSRDLVNPIDDDFTRPAGPVEEVAFIGRPAWRVMLAPPPHKPGGVWQVLDVESGVTLAYQSRDGQTLLGFTSLESYIEPPPGAFALPGDGNSGVGKGG